MEAWFEDYAKRALKVTGGYRNAVVFTAVNMCDETQLEASCPSLQVSIGKEATFEDVRDMLVGFWGGGYESDGDDEGGDVALSKKSSKIQPSRKAHFVKQGTKDDFASVDRHKFYISDSSGQMWLRGTKVLEATRGQPTIPKLCLRVKPTISIEEVEIHDPNVKTKEEMADFAAGVDLDIVRGHAKVSREQKQRAHAAIQIKKQEMVQARRQSAKRFLVFCGFYLALLFSILVRYPLRSEYSAIFGVTYGLREVPFLSTGMNGTAYFKFKDIYSWEQFWDWVDGPLRNVVGVDLSPEEYQMQKSIVAGRVRFRANLVEKQDMRTSDECGGSYDEGVLQSLMTHESDPNDTIWCYPEFSSNIEATAFPGFPYGDPSRDDSGVHSAYYYRKDERFNFLKLLPLEVPRPYDLDLGTVWGYFARYPHSGFLLDLDPTDSQTWNESTSVLRGAASNSSASVPPWGGPATRLIAVRFSKLNSNLNLFVTITITVELGASGRIVPRILSGSIPLRDEEAGTAFDYAILLFVMELIVYHIRLFVTIRRKIRHEAIQSAMMRGKATKLTYTERRAALRSKASLRHVWSAYFELWNFLDHIIILQSLCFCGFNFSLKYSDRTASEHFSLYKDEGFLSRYDMATLKGVSRILGGATLLIVTLKLFKHTAVNHHLELIVRTVVISIKPLVVYLGFYFSIICSCSVFAHFIFGRYVAEYSTFSGSFVALFRMVFGGVDTNALQDEFPILAPIFVGCYVLSFYVLFSRMFLAIIYGSNVQARSERHVQKGSKAFNNKDDGIIMNSDSAGNEKVKAD